MACLAERRSLPVSATLSLAAPSTRRNCSTAAVGRQLCNSARRVSLSRISAAGAAPDAATEAAAFAVFDRRVALADLDRAAP